MIHTQMKEYLRFKYYLYIIYHHSDDRLQILQRFQPHSTFTHFEEVLFYMTKNNVM